MLWSMGTITLSVKEQRRAEIVISLATSGLTVGQASLLMGVSERQVRRLRDSYRRFGLAAMAHGNRGRPATNRTSEAVWERVRELAAKEGPYHDVNTCHMVDLLAEHHGIVVGRSTLDRLLKAEGLRKKRRQRPVARRCRRTPCPSFGQMLQVDGSPHAWLEERAPRMCLMGAIDDGTGTLVYGRFHKTEDQKGYLMMLRSICTTHGIPMSVYHDKHTILRSPKEPTLQEQLEGREPMSQIQRVMNELGIEAIPAGSPQAKGRVERLWRTLQDRLTKEMRLSGVSTIEEANAFLEAFIPRFNARFARPAADPRDAFVALPENADLNRLFSVLQTRVVKPDDTLSLKGRSFQLLPRKVRSLPGKRVAVHITPEGDTLLYDAKTPLAYRLLEARPKRKALPVATDATAQPGAEVAIGSAGNEPIHPVAHPRQKPVWGRHFEVSHSGSCPAKDLAFYNKLAASGGHYP